MAFMPGYEFDRMSRRSVNKDMTQRLVDICAVAHGSAVVDVGCGSGVATQLLLERLGDAGSVVGIDPSVHELAIARQRLKDLRVQFIQGRAQDVEGIIEPVDAAVLSNVIHQIPAPDRESVIRSCFRMLKPGGRCALNTHFYEGSVPPDTRFFYAHWLNATSVWLRPRGSDLIVDRPKPVALEMLTPQEHEEIFARAGFSEVKVEEVTYGCTLDDWDALCNYSVFIEGATGLTDMALGSEALKAGLRATFEALALTKVPRRWLFVRGTRTK